MAAFQAHIMRHTHQVTIGWQAPEQVAVVCVCSVWVPCVALPSGGRSSAGSSPLCGSPVGGVLPCRVPGSRGICSSSCLSLALTLSLCSHVQVIGAPGAGTQQSQAHTVESRIRPKGRFGLTPGELSTLSKSNPYPKSVSTPAQKLRKKKNL